MHAAWHLNEIRLLVLDNLGPGDCARLARTSKFLFETATDYLWADLTSLQPFICCLSSHQNPHPTVDVDKVARLDLYSRKVKTITLESKDANQVIRLPKPFGINKNKDKKPKQKYTGKSWREIWTEIATLRSSTNFLPNLRKLRVNHIVEELLLPFVGISGAHLTYLYIKIIHERVEESIVAQLLESLHDNSKLEYLFIRDGDNHLIPPGFIARAPLKHLRLDPRIRANQISGTGFPKHPLSAEVLYNNELEHLTIGLTRDWYHDDISRQGKYLPSLRTLWLNLRTFMKSDCDERCTNIDTNVWTCRRPTWNLSIRDGNVSSKSSNGPFDCGRKPPQTFIEGLDNPELELLNVKFDCAVDRTMLLDIVKAFASHCRLENLQQLALNGGGYIPHCSECVQAPEPNIGPQDMKDALRLLLPLPKLKVLRLPIVPDLLKDFDLEFFNLMARGLPSLEAISIGNSDFLTSSQFTGTQVYERMPLRNIAAFCRLIPTLVDVDVGCVNGLDLEEIPNREWACLNVKKLRIRHWININAQHRYTAISRDRLHRNLRTYFPNSDQAEKEYNEMLYIFHA